MDRRQFFSRTSNLGLPLTFLPYLSREASASEGDKNPHFLLILFASQGWETTYLCDARPLAMTEGHLLHNYMGEEPKPLIDIEGRRSLYHRPFEQIRSEFYAGDFSIVNGVTMDVSFDGHEQNKSICLTGHSTGGRLIAATTSDNFEDYSMAAYISADLFGVNFAPENEIFRARGEAFDVLVQKARQQKAITMDSEDYLQSTYERILSETHGSFHRGVLNALNGRQEKRRIVERLASIEDLPVDLSPFQKQVLRQLQCFKAQICGGGVAVIDESLDTHDAESAQGQPGHCETLMGYFKQTLQILKQTAFDETSSFFDHTTLVMTSEFSRTMRQSDLPVSATGTDHNAYYNLYLIGGKGIRGGQIVGASDFQTPKEILSRAHTSKDSGKFKLFGRPFDYRTQKISDQLPETFRQQDYLNYASIANTLMVNSGVDRNQFWKIGRDENPAPIISTLLK